MVQIQSGRGSDRDTARVGFLCICRRAEGAAHCTGRNQGPALRAQSFGYLRPQHSFLCGHAADECRGTCAGNAVRSGPRAARAHSSARTGAPRVGPPGNDADRAARCAGETDAPACRAERGARRVDACARHACRRACRSYAGSNRGHKLRGDHHRIQYRRGKNVWLQGRGNDRQAVAADPACGC